MRFENLTGSLQVSYAIHEAERLLVFGSPMMKELNLKNDWKYNSGSGEAVVSRLLIERAPLKVKTYRPWNPLTSAIGNYSSGVTSFNVYKVTRLTTTDMIRNLLHEYSHYAGFHHVDPGWLGKRRANYQTPEKSTYSVPYYISENVGRWL